jgi:hypothetical protein
MRYWNCNEEGRWLLWRVKTRALKSKNKRKGYVLSKRSRGNVVTERSQDMEI